MVSINHSTFNDAKNDKPKDQTKQVKIAAIGDSQSVGLCPGGYVRSWPVELQAKLDFLQDKKYDVKNYAVSGSTILRPYSDLDEKTALITAYMKDRLKEHSYWNRESY